MGKVFGFVITAGIVVLLAVVGLGMVATGLGERSLGEVPEVALAFQAVTVTHEESSGVGEDREERTVTDYQRVAPEVLVASDGAHAVGVLPAGVDLRFVPERAAGRLAAGGVLPAEAAPLVSSAFTGIPDRTGADVSVRAIPEGAEVTVHGTVQLVDGAPVLAAPADAPFVVTPLAWEEVVKEAGTSGTLNLVLGALLVLGSLAIVASRLRARLRGAPAAA